MIIIEYALGCACYFYVPARATGERHENAMSRAHRPRLPANAPRAAAKPAPIDSAQIAEDIGLAALDLAQQAHAAGLTSIGFLLESVALEAGSVAAAVRWPANRSSG